ncbi:MAG: TetR/AcrR family transcriptional regulator [Isosphaeraceae bacterium]|nr:TetR/AcrR family transcriptional regulator [Isosphaeraceae bacterium]
MHAVDREEHNREVKRKILDAAREVLLADGVDGFSMRKLGAKIGYTATGIYHHFADKQGVLKALLDADFKAFRAGLGRIGKIDDPIERLRKMGIAYVEFASAHQDHYRLLFMTPQLKQVDGEITCGDPAEDAYAFLRETVTEALAAGAFRPEFKDADELSQIIWGGVHGLVSLHIAKANDPWVPWKPLKATFRRMNDALIRGLTVAE